MRWVPLFVFVFIVVPLVAVAAIVYATVNAPTVTDCCTLACRTINHLPEC